MTRSKVFAAAIGIWFLFLLVAVSLGAVRELAIRPLIGERASHVVGTLLVVAVFWGIIWFYVKRIRSACQPGDLWRIGLLWTVLTVGFEILFFHFVAGVPWEALLADYNLLAGRVWLLVLLTTLCGPAVIGWWQRRTRA